MRRLAAFGFLILLVVVLEAEAQSKSALNITSKCLGNIMRVDVGPLGGKLLDVAVVTNSSSVFLSPRSASQCGFSLTADQLGNVAIYASVQNCFAQNVEDKAFTTTLTLHLHGHQLDEDEQYQVVETCPSSAWASREIVCNYNYMEVSVKKASDGDYLLTNYPVRRADSTLGGPRGAAERRPAVAGFRVTGLLFFTPEERMMTVSEALRRGYAVDNTPSRLLLRSPKNSPETYVQNVAGVPMTVLRTSAVLERRGLMTRTNAAAACPLMEGSVFFTPDTITWYLPRRVDPLVSSARFRLLEVHVGVAGQRLRPSEAAARRFSVSVNNVHVVIRIPVGAVGGYSKSRVQDNRYFTFYTIELMVELLWVEGADRDTRYKVLSPITTPLLPQPVRVTDGTVPGEQRFKVMVGPFATDVALVNITFASEVLSVSDCIVRGFNLMERRSPNYSSRSFTLEVPFADPVVLKLRENGLMSFRLQLTFGLLVLPEFAPFSHTAYLEAKLAEPVPPSVSGSCDLQFFHVLVEYGTQSFHTIVGNRSLTSVLAQQYGFRSNGTHFSLVVPFSAPDVAFQAIEGSYIRGRLKVILRSPETNSVIKDFSLACNFPSLLTECFPNGTMTTWAVKLDLIPSLNTSQLTLRDPSCGPSYSDERLAYFVFTATSCGTTRKFLSDAMLYENEISLPDDVLQQVSEPEEPVYELKVSCYYDLKTSNTVDFQNENLPNELYAENTKGEFPVAIRIALDKSYRTFYRDEDYPIAKYLQPLYLELELMRATNPRLSLEVENCWATREENRMSQPRWNLIVEGCANEADPYSVVFHPVWTDARVRNPSHFKRFEVQTSAFPGNEVSGSQVFVHCDVVICEARMPLGGVCNRQCPNTGNRKGHRRAASHMLGIKLVSTGPIKV
ncbi:uncharacterized protein LOC114850094 [Betta splendens]|uniref:Uncharacterized protein LOC114850094 n=1 Tax=Betta splendens TaxID=158456 RepID=A0A6P7LVH6_BETSP|nr:uncharacterized protein LOC114850094 [Betta splendens]